MRVLFHALLLVLAGCIMLGGTGCSWRKGTHYSPENDPRPEPKLKRTPYTVNGKRYRPMDIATALQYSETGEASVYNDGGSIGAMGERLPKGGKYAAHRTLPLPSVVRVTSLKTGKSCDVRVCDRGPFHRRRIIDISPAVARAIGCGWGVHQVKVETISVGDGPNQRRNED